MVDDWKHAVKKFTKQERGLYDVDFKGLLAYWVDFIKSKKTRQEPLIKIKTQITNVNGLF